MPSTAMRESSRTQQQRTEKAACVLRMKATIPRRDPRALKGIEQGSRTWAEADRSEQAAKRLRPRPDKLGRLSGSAVDEADHVRSSDDGEAVELKACTGRPVMESRALMAAHREEAMIQERAYEKTAKKETAAGSGSLTEAALRAPGFGHRSEAGVQTADRIFEKRTAALPIVAPRAAAAPHPGAVLLAAEHDPVEMSRGLLRAVNTTRLFHVQILVQRSGGAPIEMFGNAETLTTASALMRLESLARGPWRLSHAARYIPWSLTPLGRQLKLSHLTRTPLVLQAENLHPGTAAKLERLAKTAALAAADSGATEPEKLRALRMSEKLTTELAQCRARHIM